MSDRSRRNDVALVGMEGGIFSPSYRSRAYVTLKKAISAGGMEYENFDIDTYDEHTKAIITFTQFDFERLTRTRWEDRKRGFVYKREDQPWKVLGTFHPSYIGRGKTGLTQALIFDLKLGWKKPTGSYPLELLTLTPTVEEFYSWWMVSAKRGLEFIAFDIETPYSAGAPDDEELEQDPSSEIIRISFALPDGRAITVPWVGGYIDVCRDILGSSTPKLLFNADYDVPRCEVNQCKVNGTIIDVMWLFHFLFPDLPRSLASAASFYTTLPEWKSLGSREPELYSALDSHATVMTYLGVRTHLKQKGMWVAAWDHVVRLMGVLRRMRTRGLLIHLEKLESFKTFLSTETERLSSLIDSRVPSSVKNIKTTTAKHLRGHCLCLTPKRGKRGQVIKGHIPYPSCVQCGGTGWNPPIVTTLPFNPESTEQLKAYIRLMGHKMPTRTDRNTGETKEVTEKKFIIVLSRQYPTSIYVDVLRHKQLQKLLSTYVAWPLHESGFAGYAKVSTRLSQAPATGRLSSVNPNMQNIPKEGELAERFKDIIHATPGHRIVKRDYSGIEAVLTGYFAGDPEYMRLALLGVHTYRCAQYKGEPPDHRVSDKDLAAALKVLKRKYDHPEPGEDVSLYQRFKKINHMTNYGAKPMKIFNESPGVFKDLPEVRKLYAFFRQQSPRIFQWHQRLQRQIPREGYRVVTPYMYNRYFWDLPADLPKAIAQLPQSTAAAIIKESMLIVDQSPDGEFLVLQVHDELVFDFPEGPGSCECHPDNKLTWQERDARVAAIMERPLGPLGGLRINTEGASGLTYLCH